LDGGVEEAEEGSMMKTTWMRSIATFGLLVASLAGTGCDSGVPPASESPTTPDLVAEQQAETEIHQLLDYQVAAWNEGDLEGFMSGYLRGDELRFVSGTELRRGWDTALRRYRETYPDRAAMGTLAFEELDVRLLDTDWAMVTGIFRLVREADEPWGRFTLILHDGEDGWRIVHDHTSS
jgi:ketosteroid isomerase-like protein